MAQENKAQSEIRYLNPVSVDVKKKKYCRFKKLGIRYVDYKDGIVPNNTYSFDFRIDNECSVLTKVEYRTEIERDDKENPIHTYMDMYVYDNQYAAAVLPCFITGENENATLQMLTSHAIPVRGERRSVTKVSWDITEYLDYADENYDFFFIQLTDYALNTSMFAVTLPRDVTLSLIHI